MSLRNIAGPDLGFPSSSRLRGAEALFGGQTQRDLPFVPVSDRSYFYQTQYFFS